MTDFLPLQHETINPIKKTCKFKVQSVTVIQISGIQKQYKQNKLLCGDANDAMTTTVNYPTWFRGLQNPSTYCNECPVPKVIGRTEEPEFMKKEVRPSDNTLI